MYCSTFKENFNLNGIPEVYFWKSQFENFNPYNIHTPVSLLYVTYRFLYMCWFVLTLIVNFTCHTIGDEFYLIYLTSQSTCIQLFYSTLYFGYTAWKKCKKNDDICTSEDNPLPLITKLLWILMSVVHSVPLIVSLVYWAFLSHNRESFEKECRFTRNHFVHSFNSGAAIMDSLIVSAPARFTHCLFPIGMAVWYTLFSIMYEIFGGPLPEEEPYIYSILHWRSDEGPVGALVTALGAMIGVFLAFVIFRWGLHHLKLVVCAYMKIGPQQHLPASHQTLPSTGIQVPAMDKSMPTNVQMMKSLSSERSPLVDEAFTPQ